MSRFNECLAFTWRPECDGQPLHVTPGDHGGATAWGVTLASYASWRADNGVFPTTQADLAAASKTDLAALIHSRYWNAIQGDHLPVGVDLLAYDFGYTAGPGTSARLLQEVVGGLRTDGQLGPVTLAAVARIDRIGLIHRLGARHEAYYESLSGFALFGRGWSNRNAARVQAALAAPVATPVSAPVIAPVAVPHVGMIASAFQEVRHALGA
ncbi:MAG: glycosyl hydrolase 108 family protein [Janthinobacterium lividum]